MTVLDRDVSRSGGDANSVMQSSILARVSTGVEIM